jgi:hypothetical protein
MYKHVQWFLSITYLFNSNCERVNDTRLCGYWVDIFFKYKVFALYEILTFYMTMY